MRFKWGNSGLGEQDVHVPEKKTPVIKLLDHPDNRKLVKRSDSSGEDYSPVESGRTCTDVLFLILLVCAWTAMTGVGLAATGLIKSEVIKKGDPRRLINGLDYHANICGVTNYQTPLGADVINLPKAYPLPSGYFVCVERCPSVTNYDEFHCEYEVEEEIHSLLKSAEDLGVETVDITNTKKSLQIAHTSQKQCMPYIKSTSFLSYCIPDIPLDSVLLTDSVGQNDSNETISITSNVTTSNNETPTEISITMEDQINSQSDFFDKLMTDVYNVRYVIFYFGCGMAMVLGIVFLVVIQLPGFLSLLVWTMIIAVDASLIGAGWYTKETSLKWASSETRGGNEAVALFYASYVLYGLAVLWVMIICYIRRRIVLAIYCVKESARAISAMPVMTLFPVAQVLGLVAFTVVWGVYMAFLASSGDVTGSCKCPSSKLGEFEYESNVTTSRSLQTTEASESISDYGCEDGCFLYKELTYSTNTKYAALYMLFMW